jgi:hypothetical protein
MGECYKCKVHLPPDFMFAVENKPVQECVFCKNDTQNIHVENKNGDVIRTLSKQECINRYKEFMSEMVDKPEIRKKLAKDVSIIQ